MMNSYINIEIIQALLLFMLPWLSRGISCSSRYYCVTKEIKFISMEEIPKAFLNATSISTRKVQNASQCQQFCVRENKCRSINLIMNNRKGYNCHLLDVNKYSNSSLLIKDDKSSHLYIPSKCDGNPCKNQGVCVPTYNNDSYVCECKSNASWITRGRHCETVLDGYKSAFIYYSFNDVSRMTPYSSTNMVTSPYSIKWKGVRVFDRKSPVTLCKKCGAACTEIGGGVPCINSFHSCKSTVTYSIWVKFRAAQVGKKANIIQKHSSSLSGLSFISHKNAYDFKCSISALKEWDILQFGKWVRQTKWNQFTFTIDDNRIACAYINGLKEKCQTLPRSVNYQAAGNNAIRIGGAWYAKSEPMMHFDDFGIWQVALTADEVMNLYNLSKD